MTAVCTLCSLRERNGRSSGGRICRLTNFMLQLGQKRLLSSNRYIAWICSVAIVIKESMRKFALQNAILHGGRADSKAVLGKVLAQDEGLRLRARELAHLAEEAVAAVNELTLEEQRRELEELAPKLLERARPEKVQGLSSLPSVGEKVVMRLAPYPSGPLHIGNTRMVILNDEYVKRYKGKLVLVYDDTIGSDEKRLDPKAYEQIREGLEWLGVEVHEVHYKSDRLPTFYDWAIKLIQVGEAYVCECDTSKLRQHRERAEACPHRSQDIDETEAMWQGMLQGAYDEGEATLRLKTDMRHPNPAFRDRVLFRISEREHPRVGRRFRVWPLLEFSWAIDDHLLGITHVLRGKDLVMEDLMETAIWDKLGIEHRPAFVHYGMMYFKGVDLSKSKFQREIREGALSGIDDPRTWSLQSLRKRGISPQAIRSFILSLGLSLTDVEIPAENLYAENRKIIDSQANRYFFVPDPVTIRVEGLPAIKEVRVPLHPDFPSRGTRVLKVAPEIRVARQDFEKYKGKEVRLKDFCNIVLNHNAAFTSRELKELPKIQWVAEGLTMRVTMPDATVVKGLVESGARLAKIGDVMQMERFGFVKLDSMDDEIRAYFAHR